MWDITVYREKQGFLKFRYFSQVIEHLFGNIESICKEKPKIAHVYKDEYLKLKERIKTLQQKQNIPVNQAVEEDVEQEMCLDNKTILLGKDS